MKLCLPFAAALASVAVFLPVHAQRVPAAGTVRLFRTTNVSSNPYTDDPSGAMQSWLRSSFWGMLTYSPYFDTRLSWYPNGFVYIDSYAIYTDSAIATQYPQWILKDAQGNNLYIPWGCSNGVCPQFAGDFSNPAFCQWWIGQAQGLLSIGYAGLFIDDVNMDFRVGNGAGSFVRPIDANTGAPMTLENWRLYMARFMAQVRAAFPNTGMIQNSLWWAGLADQDPNVQIQISAANYLNIEFGVNDPNLTGGNGAWSLNSLLGYIDRLHAAGKGAILGGVPSDLASREYALAGYYLISTGQDALGSTLITPANWWPGFGANLGTPLGPRITWNGLLRRNYTGGMVLLNPPQSPVITVQLGESAALTRTSRGPVRLQTRYQSVSGSPVNSVTLGPAQGAVLLAAQ